MHSGLRSLRDKALLYFEEAFAKESATRDRLYRVVNLYAQQVRRVARKMPTPRAGGAQVQRVLADRRPESADSAHRLFLVYPEGNWVEIGPDTPYQIIGASGFGKPILERSLTRCDSMLYAFKVGLLAFDATRLCAADVDFPMDVILYSRAASRWWSSATRRDDLREISNWWQERMRRSVHDLPSEWIEAAFSSSPATNSRSDAHLGYALHRLPLRPRGVPGAAHVPPAAAGGWTQRLHRYALRSCRRRPVRRSLDQDGNCRPRLVRSPD